MHTKLTITVDEHIILKAKSFAKKQGKSLSSLIENYLRVATREEIDETNISKKIRKLKGVIKVPTDFDYKTELGKAIYEKHMR